MEILNPRCAGLDVHKNSVVVCLKLGRKKETRTFKTFMGDLRALGNWLMQAEVTTIVMESTGVYWKPIWNLFEEEFSSIELVLANAEHVKQVPGRKTDVCDAEWLADLHSCGLIRGSRVPDRANRELQELARARRKLIEERSRILCRIQKLLEGANIKLASVVSTITTKAGMAVIRALAEGEKDPLTLQKLTETGLKAKPEEILAALEGTVGRHQRLLLGVELDVYSNLTKNIELLDREVDERMRPFEETVVRLDEIPGISRRGAQEILIFAGPTLEGFSTAGHLAAWAGLCPGNSISAGKSSQKKSRRGNLWLKGTMIEAAWPAIRTRNSYFKDLYHRKKATRGAQKAIVAVAHSMLVTIYHMVTRGTRYCDLGPNYHKKQQRDSVLKRRLRELSQLGFEIIGVRDLIAA